MPKAAEQSGDSADALEDKPAGAFLCGLGVQGFRGIGPKVDIDLQPQPGLTIIAGRNGSGKSSLAEALEVALLDGLARRRSAELERGVCLVGPHRDDLDLILGEQPAKGFASHGESWSIALALRLAAYELLRSEGAEPVLLLDDVFAELDRARRTALAGVALTAEQVLVTAAVAGDIPAELNA